jgi:toxin ParE1/3/4
MARPRLSVLAERDLEELSLYIARDSPRAAQGVTRRILRMAQTLADQPGMGRARPELTEGIRSFPAEGYVLLYRIVQDGIEVARVLHGSRDIDAAFGEHDR